MIIVSQNKNVIVNFNNLTQIYITYCKEDNTGYFIRFETVDSLYDNLGEYATEERAKEVLKEIVQCYANTEQYKSMSNTASADFLNELLENAIIYAMPEK